MKRYFLSVFFFFSSFLYANVNAIVSILPEKIFLQEIGGDLVHISLMVNPGDSPHSYEPKPSQMREIENAQVYFSIGVEFEEVWLEKFKNQNKSLLFVDVSKNIEKIEIAHHSHTHEKHHDTNQEDESHDPHVWTSPKNIKIIAHEMLQTLIKLDSKNQAIYEKNYQAFIQKIDTLDLHVRDILKDVPKETKFMVFHPSWGYFAKEYNLMQFPIEVEGKEPKPKELMYILKEAKEENVKAIFTQPEFSDKSAKIIANELKIKVIKVSPLSIQWEENLVNIAKAIANR